MWDEDPDFHLSRCSYHIGKAQEAERMLEGCITSDVRALRAAVYFKQDVKVQYVDALAHFLTWLK